MRSFFIDMEASRNGIFQGHSHFNPQPQKSSVLQLAFPAETPLARLQEYSNLVATNCHRETNGSYTTLAVGFVDFVLVSRLPSADEMKLAEKGKMSFDARPVAKDALVFIGNVKNPINGLSQEQVRGIYSGRIKNWKQVGGEDKEIYAVTRGANSGSQELLETRLMQNRPVIEGKNRIASSMAGILDMAEKNENSIAYSVFYYERIMNPRAALKPLAINGVLPTSKTIANGQYSLTEPVYVVTRKDIAPDSPTAILPDWLLSKAGQKLIAQSGYAPIWK